MTDRTDDFPINRILQGDCVQVMRGLPAESVDFVLTDPPYLVRYRDRSGRRVANDDRADWLRPAFAEMFRLMKPGTLALSFYGWNRADLFFDAWKAASLAVVGHLVFRKDYASRTRFFAYHHEQAFLLAKGDAPLPADPLPDVMDWRYTGNRLHPTQKPAECLTSLVGAFCRPGGIVLDRAPRWSPRAMRDARISASNSTPGTRPPPAPGSQPQLPTSPARPATSWRGRAPSRAPSRRPHDRRLRSRM